MKEEYPAFPIKDWYLDSQDHNGMSLRDYFAARASEEDIREHQSPWTTSKDRCKPWETIIPNCSREVAKYRYADAMLKAREAK